MPQPVLKIENLSKRYRLGLIGSNSLQGDLQSWWYRLRGRESELLTIGAKNTLNKAGGDYIWALKNIDLSINKGDILGVVGKNGAGKSTLLKILSRVTGPTIGNIKVKGRIGSLLEVGTGFHPELTGRENIYLNGAILGMKRSEITKKFDQIVDFSGIEKYVNTPVKRYSSGMYVRLAFSVAAHLEPDILIVDEVLAVGDIEFQKKAIGKMEDVSEQDGRTVLFVSHNMRSVQQLCNKGVFLENGELAYSGTVDGAINYYFDSVMSGDSTFVCEPQEDLEAYINNVQIEDLQGVVRRELPMGSQFRIRMHYKVNSHLENFVVAVGVAQLTGVPISTTWRDPERTSPGEYEAVFTEMTLRLGPGTYRLSIGLSNNQKNIQYSEDFYFSISDAADQTDEYRAHISTHCAVLNQMNVAIQRLK